MKSFISIILIIPLILLGDIVLQEEQIYSVEYDYCCQDIISDTLLVLHKSCSCIEDLNFIIKACSFYPICIDLHDSDTLNIKSAVDSVSCIHCISAIVIIGNIDELNAFYRINPYDNSTFCTDCPYGMYGSDIINSVPVARIPFADCARIMVYCSNALRYLSSESLSSIGLMGHFYDADMDSVEDYLYMRSLNSIHNVIDSIFDTDMLLTADHLGINRFYDLSPVPLYMQYPQEHFDADIQSINNTFLNPACLLFWGHANQYSTVAPEINLSDLSNLYCPFSGTACLFSCLAGDITTECIAESLICCNRGLSAIAASSSLTFYQYNRYMTDMSVNYMKEYSSLSAFINSMRHSLLDFAGINKYSIAHAQSYAVLGLPFIPVSKGYSGNILFINDSIDLASSSIDISVEQACTVNVFSKHMYEEHFASQGNNCISLSNIYPGDTVFVSSFTEGQLVIDTAFVEQAITYCSDIVINDSTGDFDLIPEFGESLLIEMNAHCTLLPCTLHFLSDVLHLKNESIILYDTLQKISISAVVASVSERALLYVQSSNYNACFAFTITSREILADSFAIHSSSSVMTDSMYCTALYMRTGNHTFDSCWISFKEGSVDFYNDSVFVHSTQPYFIIFNYAVFREDSGSFTVYAHSRFLRDSIEIHYSIEGEKSLCVYDPLHNYPDNSLLINMADSLNVKIVKNDNPAHSPICSAYFFSMGNYPNNIHLEDSLAAYILYLSGKSNIFIEGNDCLGYDNAGELLWEQFGLTDCSDGMDLIAGTEICFPMSHICAYLKQELKSADLPTTDNPLIMYKGSPLGAFCECNLSQSVPLYMIESDYLNNIYYSYLSFLMNTDTDIRMNSCISLSDSQTFLVHNDNQYPVYADIVYTPAFLDSCILSSNYIRPDSFIHAYCYIRPCIKKGNDSIVIMTDILHQFSSTVHYRQYAQSQSCWRNTDRGIVIYKNNNNIILPQFHSSIACTDLGDSIVIQSLSYSPVPVKVIQSDTLGNITNIFTITVLPAESKVYNILGQYMKDARVPGIYFDNNGKFAKIR